ncbi:uncharacterized protein SCODWIG_00825 [Saccharomycodes ludwigii]|uniref:Uncharacterized protein n=1 Tax=Saccharomycodes ludwigii TaxID=36035 RepID=A0A376B3K6_9ASCO|nr:hypothetical protein SCDLUD_002771 [Saccharomycodes ludwigii]KAH3901281.1 hypothetical protein SCDLUD_002771 [Saccharomycodes ludwigii]SSD59064.1 uncharacterized protein SCODWIG_00825 [Saccharomycodes ludwigii]
MFTPSKANYNTSNNNMKNPLSSLLGTDLNTWPYGEQTLHKALELKCYQEVTKQQFYKLELIKSAMQANIPGNLIPQLFSNNTAFPMQIDMAKSKDNNLNSINNIKQPIPGTNVENESNILKNQKIKLQTFKFPPESSKTPTSLYTSNSIHRSASVEQTGAKDITTIDNNSIPEHKIKTHRRTNSPARIGAKAVEALNGDSANFTEEQEDAYMGRDNVHDTNSYTNRITGSPIDMNCKTTNIRNFSPSHRRNQSLPAVLKPSPFAPEMMVFRPKFTYSGTRSTLVENNTYKVRKNLNTNNPNNIATKRAVSQIDLNRIEQYNKTNNHFGKKIKFRPLIFKNNKVCNNITHNGNNLKNIAKPPVTENDDGDVGHESTDDEFENMREEKLKEEVSTGYKESPDTTLDYEDAEEEEEEEEEAEQEKNNMVDKAYENADDSEERQQDEMEEPSIHINHLDPGGNNSIFNASRTNFANNDGSSLLNVPMQATSHVRGHCRNNSTIISILN